MTKAHDSSRRFRLSSGGLVELLDSADPSVVADYTATYENVRSMRPVPATLRNVATVAGILALPFLPLTLTAFSLQDVLQRLADALI